MLLPYLNENLIEAGCDEAGRGCLAMTTTVFGYQFRVVTKFQCPANAFHRLVVLFGRITFDWCVHSYFIKMQIKADFYRIKSCGMILF